MSKLQAPAALLPEGVLNPARETSEASVSGEAPAALLPEGVLNPNNWVLNRATHVTLWEARPESGMTWAPR